jgi:hypothetical protein
MKKLALPCLIILSFLPSCEKPVELTDRQVFLKVGDEYVFRFDDIELYDSSTHIIYFKEVQNEFNEILQGRFTFFDKGDTIYSGTVVPGYSCSIPSGPIIFSAPSMYGNHALRIELWMGNKPDMRNCPKIIEILKEHNLLNSGLSGRVDFVEVDGNELSFGFTIVNHDLTDLLIIDLNKTGSNLFHYFTNGLYLRTEDHDEIFSSTIEHQTPEPCHSWEPEWLSVLKSGESKSFTINYPMQKAIDPGEYRLLFEFPGLAYQVSREDLFQGSARVWLGDVILRDLITIQ